MDRNYCMIVLVGQNPVRAGAQPFADTKSMRTLSRWIKEAKIGRYMLLNACNSPGKPKMTEEDQEKLRIWTEHEENIVIALGSFASKALTKQGKEHFKMPHPSGRNRQLNDKEYVEKKLADLRGWVTKKVLLYNLKYNGVGVDE